MKPHLRRLRQLLAKTLRHTPWELELELDDDGWVSTADLLDALRPLHPQWANLTEADLATATFDPEKQRYEMIDGRIRALYGHSIPQRLAKTPAAPPDVLYHGTTSTALPVILAHGLKPMSRQYVHLSIEKEMADIVARRKAADVILLIVDAAAAHRAGVPFYMGNDKVWLADSVPPQYISTLD